MAKYSSSFRHLFVYITHIAGHFAFNTVEYFGKGYQLVKTNANLLSQVACAKHKDLRSSIKDDGN